MVCYTCVKCNKTFDAKIAYDRHMNRKRSCVTVNCNITKEYKCEHCDRLFCNRYAMTRHQQNSCYNYKPPKVDETNINETNITVNVAGNIINGDVINNTVINNTNIVNNNNQDELLHIAPFGKEVYIDQISETKFRGIIYRGYSSVCQLIDQVHFNEEIPENHNICIKNLRTNYANTFDGETWELRDKEEVIDELISKKYELLEEMYDKLVKGPKKRINENRAIGFTKLKADYDKNEQTMKRLRDDVELQLYNRRHITMKTKKKYDEQQRLLK